MAIRVVPRVFPSLARRKDLFVCDLATITITPESSAITEEQDEQQEKEKKAVINAPETVTTVHMEYLL